MTTTAPAQMAGAALQTITKELRVVTPPLENLTERFGPDPNHTDDPDDTQFWDNACRGMLKQEDRWQQRGNIFAWIDRKPTWVSAASWDDYLGDGFPPAPTRPTRRIIRFSLIGGGQVRVTERWTDRKLFAGDNSGIWCEGKPGLLVTAHGEPRQYGGYLSSGYICEMATCAVVFRNGTPQQIADRTATTLRAIDSKTENFHALLDGSKGCAFCSRPLRDPISKAIGVGPDCAKQNLIPHSLAAANKRIELRRKLLEGGVS